MLAWPLIVAIRLYRWAAGALPRRRTCLFDVSCSRYVERAAGEHGLAAAGGAIRERWAACRPGYTFEFDGDRWTVTCVDGSYIAADEASYAVRYEATACRLACQQLSRTPEGESRWSIA